MKTLLLLAVLGTEPSLFGDAIVTGTTAAAFGDSVVTVEPERRNRLVLLTSSTCAPCLAWSAANIPQLARSGWGCDDSPGSFLQIIDIDREPDAVARWGIESTPVLVHVKDGAEVSRVNPVEAGYDFFDVAALLNRRNERPKPQAPAVHATGGPHWTHPGDIRSHLRDGHGFNAPSNWTTEEMKSWHDAAHEGRTYRPQQTRQARGLFGRLFCPTCPR